MEQENLIQVQLFDRIREQLPKHVSLVDEVADILKISTDSAYRRIRGEKTISLDEIQKLASVFDLSLDDLTGNKRTLTFETFLLNEEENSFRQWFEIILKITNQIVSHKGAEAIFILNELNIFHLFQFPELLAFKLFFWQKSSLGFIPFKEAKFTINMFNHQYNGIAERITENYIKINSIEFTTEENLNSFLKQVQYYYDSGYFESRDDALIICEKLHDLVNHQQRQAELGYKFLPEKETNDIRGNFQLYYNDIILTDNTVIIKTGNSGYTFMTTNAINLLQTHNRMFYHYNYNWGMNLIVKSLLISGTAEKFRYSFFRKLHEQINCLEKKISG
ncbi:helix-turn-helix domain-containing protein [Saccharicrinis sp. FJH54]|uniref:helix-turn-helix domain-containing protein n=1 Tax=Saccharicrinis sp. FJH54 TaxID=3344665 RepID=UPI0035D51AFC